MHLRILDTQSQLELAFDARERFAMCSTFKLLLVAAILKRVGVGALSLESRLPVREQDMVPYAPITSQHITAGSSRLRARVPADWRPGDKTGNGRNGAANDLLVAWPPGRSAVIAAVYMSESQQPVSALDQAHAAIGGLFAAAVARQ